MTGTKRFAPHLFYLGTLISSTGSITFNVCMAAFMIQNGFSLFKVSLILGGQRLLPLFISTLVGHVTDLWHPRKSVVITEICAAICSLGILWGWSLGESGYWFLLAFCLLRASVLSLQGGSRAKISKMLSEADYASNSKNAIWLNKATQGATLFAGVIGWTSFKYLSFSWAVVFDAVTFIISGLCVWYMTLKEEERTAVSESITGLVIFQKFKDLYRYNRRAAIIDLCLAFVMMGTASFTTRLAGAHQEWNPIFIIAYGVAVWLAGFIERSKRFNLHSAYIWAGLGIGYILLGMFPEYGWLTFGFSVIKDLCYWLIFHRISGYIQHDTPKAAIGSVSIARTVQMVLVLATGELIVGGWEKTVPIFWDGAWRAILCFSIILVLCLPKFRAELSHDRPTL